MNVELVKLTVKSAEHNLIFIINKFLCSERFSARDMYWWWNPAKSWMSNRTYVKKAIEILREEKCLKIFGAEANISYSITPAFRKVLLEMSNTENLLRSCTSFESKMHGLIRSCHD